MIQDEEQDSLMQSMIRGLNDPNIPLSELEGVVKVIDDETIPEERKHAIVFMLVQAAIARQRLDQVNS